MDFQGLLYQIRYQRIYLLGGITVWQFSLICLLAAAIPGIVCLAGVVQLELDYMDIGGIEVPQYMILYLGAPVGLITASICALRPMVGICLFTIFLPFRGDDYIIASLGGADVRIADLFIVPGIVGWFFRRFFIEKRPFSFRAENIELPALLLLWWSILSLSWSQAYFSTISKLIQFIYGLIILIVIADSVKTKKEFCLVLFMWLLGGLLISGSAVFEQLSSGVRAESLQTSALETGEYLNYPILLCLPLFFLLKEKTFQLVVFLSIATMLIGSFASGSRGPILGLIGALGFLALFSKRYRTYFFSLACIGAIALSCLVIILFLVEYKGVGDMLIAPFSRFINLFESSAVPDVGEIYRIFIWKGIWQIFLEYPLLGIGVGSLPDMLPQYVPQVFLNPTLAHNLYLEIFIAVGPFGFLLFLWCLVVLAKIVLRLLDQEDRDHRLLALAVAAALVAQLVGGMTFGLFYENRVLWTSLGLLFALYMNFYKRSDSHG